MQETVVIGVLRKEQEVLIVRRKQKEGDLFWQFPGGGVESGETEEAAVKREVLEETGITVNVEFNLGRRVHPSTGKEIAYFACSYVSGDINIADEDLDAAIWVSIEDVMRYFTTPVFKPIQDYLGIA